MALIALVTGTSTGIGSSTAVHLARSGYTVVATMRNMEKREPLEQRALAEGIALDIRQLDVQDEESIQRCVHGLLDDYGHIDLLVNNAGAGYLGTMEQTSMEALERTMDVNFFGVWRTTQAVLPAMRRAGSGRIISISSVGGLFGQPFNDAYCAAKFAVEGFMESLAPVAAGLGIQVSIVEPGPVNTEFVASVRDSMPDLSAPDLSAYWPMLGSYIAGTQQIFATMGQTADDIAAVIVEAATTEKPHFRYVTSERILEIVKMKYVDPTGNSVVAISGARLS